ncbi:MAG: ubiquinone biosynthesis protein UbiB, partial [Brevundimonas sp.]|nr:ubiquinone biosynthesis protein UbiB [Brevundimonas sp.]
RVHFEAGYVPPGHSVEAFAQALRAVGEPVIGKAASQVSMGRLLGQLFEITALFDMHLRPELILLQKTMVSVEGVARRLNPDHDLWAASQPVVERWIRRELGPQAQVRDAIEELRDTLKALSRLARNPPEARTVVIRETRTPAWVIVGVTLAVAASAAALVLSLWPFTL